MVSHPRRRAMYNTPTLRTGGFGALQVEAITNRPLSIARRHLAASQLRMRDIEPDELSSSEWVRFLVMEERERDRWMADFTRRRRSSSSSSTSSSSSASDSSNSSSPTSSSPTEDRTRRPHDGRRRPHDKAEEAMLEAVESGPDPGRRGRRETGSRSPVTAGASAVESAPRPVVGTTPAVSLWVRQFDGDDPLPPRPPMHVRRAMDSLLDAPPPTYESATRSRTPPPAYEPRR